MKRTEHLSLAGVVCRLAPGDRMSELAATQWEQTFGIPRSRDLNAFTNARLGFIAGQEGEPEGIVSITIGVKGEKRRDAIFKRAEALHLVKHEKSGRYIQMFGLRWNFTLISLDEGGQSKL